MTARDLIEDRFRWASSLVYRVFGMNSNEKARAKLILELVRQDERANEKTSNV